MNRNIRIFFITSIFIILFLLVCYSAYRSYILTIFHVETVEINMFHNTLPTQLAQILKTNDAASLKRVLESNFSLFGIVVTSKDGDEIIALNKTAEKKGITIEQLKNIKEPYDEIIWPPQSSYYTASYPHAYSDTPIIQDRIKQGAEIIGRIYYLRRDFPRFFDSLLLWPNKLFTGYYRIWSLLIPIFLFITLLSVVSLELIISNNLKKRKILEQELESKCIEHKNLIARLEGLEKAIDKSTREKNRERFQ